MSNMNKKIQALVTLAREGAQISNETIIHILEETEEPGIPAVGFSAAMLAGLARAKWDSLRKVEPPKVAWMPQTPRTGRPSLATSCKQVASDKPYYLIPASEEEINED